MDPTIPTYVDPAAGPVGTYALIIGVSDYPHLAGGADPAPETYGLGQLTVSALTAYRFFEWIREVYRYSAAPIAKCWLLLSPTPDELAFEPKLAGHAKATMANCVTAVEAWFAALQSLSAPAARESRTVFFFSGHGVQRNEGQLMLLPGDYLRPPTRTVDALDTRNLRLGLEEVPRGEDLFFVDACRINPPDMKDLELNPRSILRTHFTSSLNPDRLAPVLYAASSGAASWQPPKPRDGISCYGQALIEGLRHPVEEKCEHLPSAHVRLLDLFRFMKGRVTELLRNGGSVVKHPIELGSIRDDLCITEALSRLPSADPGEGDDWLSGRMEVTTRGAHSPLSTPLLVEQAEIDPAGISTAESYSDLYRLFLSERVTGAWQGSRGFRLDEQAVTEVPFVLHNVDRARLAGSDTQQQIGIVLSFESEGTHWIELTLEEKRTPAFALAFPPDGGESQPRFLVEMTRDLEGEYEVEVGLSPDNTAPLRAAADLWEKYRDMDLRETLGIALQLATPQVESPLAALVAALVLIRTQQGARRKEWLRDLATGYPELPDAAVFAIEQDRRDGAWEAAPEEWAAELLWLEERILPVTNYGLRLAADQVSEALERFGAVPEEDLSEGDLLWRLKRQDERLRGALRQLHGRGLFAVFAGTEVGCGLVMARMERMAVAVTTAG